MNKIPKKIAFLYIIKLLKEGSSKENPFNYSNIAKALNNFGIKYDRKTVSRDIDMLSRTGIYAGSGWNKDNVYYSSRMFTLCKNLSGREGTAYDDAYTDKAYARIDGGTANPGYFTDIADKP